MNNRWLGTQHELKLVSSHPAESAGAAGAQPRVPKEEAFWRSWLATGARRVPIDRRRARGDEAYLKKILIGGPSGAVDFPSAMARQAIDEALHELPPQHKQVVKLAYFGGLTNREIALELGLSVSEVRRVLRASLASVGAHFDRGRARGRRAIRDLVMVPVWRAISDSAQRTPWPALDHALQAGVVVVMTAAAALLMTHQAPAHAGPAHKPAHVAAVGSAASVLRAHHATLVVVVPQSKAGPVAYALSPSPSRTTMPVMVTALVRIPVGSVLSKTRAPGIPQLPLGA
jgi:DNA-directed RNA polymerase specialized sigma24 family protein